MTREAIREQYVALPLPTTKDEHWRFTDLKGFDPDAWTANGATEIASPPTMLELDAANETAWRNVWQAFNAGGS